MCIHRPSHEGIQRSGGLGHKICVRKNKRIITDISREFFGDKFEGAEVFEF